MNMAAWWARIGPWLSGGILAALVLVPLFLVGWLMFATDIFRVQAVTVVDAREATVEKVRELVTRELNESGLLNSNHLFFIDSRSIEARVLREMPAVRSVHVQRQLPSTLKIIVQEKKPSLVLLARNLYFLIDAEGIAYEEARLETLPGVVLPVVKSQDIESTATIGTAVVSESFVGFVSEVVQRLPDLVAAEVVEVTIPSLAAREVNVRLSNNWVVRFDIVRSVDQQLNLLEDLLASTLTAEQQSALEYIDLRIANRIYYKTRPGFTDSVSP